MQTSFKSTCLTCKSCNLLYIQTLIIFRILMNMNSMSLKVSILSRETIKPSSLTPSTSKTFKLSLLDQLSPPILIPLIFFYNANPQINHHVLKSSLSETLTKFYPFAGRIKDDIISIDCNDEGALFVEAQVNCPLSKFLQNPNVEQLQKLLLPIETRNEGSTNCLLIVQVNLFECHGMAISISLSHKVADATTMSAFIKAWALTTMGSSEVIDPGPYLGPLVFPPVEKLNFPDLLIQCTKETMLCSARLVFSSSTIDELKTKTSSLTVENPSRVEAVTSLIWMAASKPTHGFSRSSICVHTLNLRKRFSPISLSSQHSFGNFVGGILIETEETGLQLQSLVCQLREELMKWREIKGVEEMFSGIRKLVEKRNDNIFTFTSWCRIPLYEADFGWGKPLWVTCVMLFKENSCVLMDTRDGNGIEAWVCLKEEDMATFQCDKELLSFCALNPMVEIRGE